MMLFRVKNPKTGEEFFFDDWKVIEKSIGITWSKFAKEDKPAIHFLSSKEQCVGDVDNPHLIITRISLGDILKSPTHF